MKCHKRLLTSVLNLTICLIVLGMLTMTLGCKTTELQGSGFLRDYSMLGQDTTDDGVAYWQDPNVSLKKYKKFMIDPVALFFAPDGTKETETINPATANKIATYLKNTLITTFGPEYTIVEEAGSDVARLRIALTSLEVNRKDLKIYNMVPAALVLTGVGEVTGIRDSIAVINMEGEFLDSITGQRVAAVVQNRGNEVSVKKTEDLKEKDVYPTLDFWALKLKERIMNSN